MRALGILLAALGGLFVLVLAGAWTLPPLMDWSRFRDSAEALASARLGRPVVIAGPISLSLLPRPMLTADDVVVREVAAGGGSFAVQSLRMQVALAPLLSGRIDASDLVLRKPALRLPWPVPPSLVAARPALGSDGFTARIEDGSVTIGGLAFDGINASLGAEAGGAVSAAGAIRIAQQPWRFAARLGSQDAAGSALLNLALDGRETFAGVGVTLSGMLAADGRFGGRVAAHGPDLSRFVPAPALAFQADGRLAAAGGLATATDLLLDLGGQPAQGSARLRVGPAARLDVSLRANRMDLDTWGPALAQGRGAGMPISADLSAEAAILSGGLLRKVRAVLDFGPETVGVAGGSATLPGDAALAFTGRISPGGDFDGRATLAAPDLAETLRWVQATPARLGFVLPPALLRSAALSGRIAVRPDAVAVDQLAGTFDDAAIRGSLAVLRGKEVGVTADLGIDRVDLDPVLPAHRPGLDELFDGLKNAKANVTLRAGEVSVRGRSVRDAALTATLNDGRLDLTTLSATLDGVHARLSGSVDGRARTVDLALQAATGDARPLGGWIGRPSLDLWRGPLTLRATAKGGRKALGLQVTGQIGDARFEAEPTVDWTTGRWHGALTLRHPGARRFVNATGLGPALGLSGPGDWLGEGSLSLVARMAGEPGWVSADSFDLTAGALHAGGTLTLTLDGETPRLVGKLAAETLPLPAVNPRSDAPLPLRALRGWQASLKVSAGNVLAGLLPVADHASAEVSLRAGVLHVERLRAGVQGGEVTGEGALDAGPPDTATPPSAALHAGWSGLALAPADSLPLITSGRAGGTADLAATGYSLATLIATASGSLRLHVADGTLAGMDLPALNAALSAVNERTDPSNLETQVRLALSQGTTPFATADAMARLAEGSVRVSDLRLESASGQIAGSGDVSLADALIDLQLRVRPGLPDGLAFGVRLSGPIAAPASHPDLTPLAAWLGGHASAAVTPQ